MSDFRNNFVIIYFYWKMKYYYYNRRRRRRSVSESNVDWCRLTSMKRSFVWLMVFDWFRQLNGNQIVYPDWFDYQSPFEIVPLPYDWLWFLQSFLRWTLYHQKFNIIYILVTCSISTNGGSYLFYLREH